MNTKRYILLAMAGAAAFFAGYFIGKARAVKPPGTVSETREIYCDTVQNFAPLMKSELVVGTHSYTLPSYRFFAVEKRQADKLGRGAGGEPRQRSSDSMIVEQDTLAIPMSGSGAGGEPRSGTDSATVELPVIQRHYADGSYEAWVSGPIDPHLDSVKVFVPTTVITKREWRPPKRWHIGVTAGYGYGAKGFQPYIGVGVTYSIFDF